eukprot:Sspe_Gene.73141::Locus_43956_Transcript_1_2_Confidence_0.667_Length_1606::g.73141::m.73141/K01442/E3.5.1.24; choloylglycine hydrolase
MRSGRKRGVLYQGPSTRYTSLSLSHYTMMYAALFLAAATLCVEGCSYFEVNPKGLPRVIANTVEWNVPQLDTPWHLEIHPRGEAVPNNCDKGAGFTAKHGFASIHAEGVGVAMNGMNEHGLSVSVHAFRGGSTRAPSANTTFTVCLDDYAMYVLGTFASVRELLVHLPHLAVASRSDDLGLMYAIADASDSIVVDYQGGTLHIHNNTVGVLTNDPEFPWHLRNLGNYLNLSPRQAMVPSSILYQTEVGAVPSALSHGQNLLGMPGDSSPPSRFVRAFYSREFAMYNQPPTTLEESLVMATSLLNSLHITKGTVAENAGDSSFDFTQVTLLKVPATRHIIFRTYFNMAWKLVDLSKVSFTESKKIAMGDGAMHITPVFP